MGQLVNLKCKKCGYETNMGIGAGITFNDLEKVINLFAKEEQDKIREAVKENGQKLWYVYKEIGGCEKCGKISPIAVFKTTDSSGNPVEIHSKCQCGSSNVEIYDYERIQKGKASIACPICGEKLVVTEHGNWD